jgi:hypothetical protein
MIPFSFRVSFSEPSYSILDCLGVTSFYKTSSKHRINRHITPLFSNSPPRYLNDASEEKNGATPIIAQTITCFFMFCPFIKQLI